MLYICEKFHNNIPNCFQLTEQKQVHSKYGYVQSSKGNNSKSRQTVFGFIYPVCCLIVLYICVKFHENFSDSIRVMERTRMMEALMDGH